MTYSSKNDLLNLELQYKNDPAVLDLIRTIAGNMHVETLQTRIGALEADIAENDEVIRSLQQSNSQWEGRVRAIRDALVGVLP